jgi:hypothetical protein
MACFWTGIPRCLDINDFKKLGINHLPRYREFVNILKNNIIPIKNVTWNNETLTEQFINDSMQHLRVFDMKKINKGYECSACDPVLILISELFGINISHQFNGSEINYTFTGATKIIHLSSNSKHMF